MEAQANDKGFQQVVCVHSSMEHAFLNPHHNTQLSSTTGSLVELWTPDKAVNAVSKVKEP